LNSNLFQCIQQNWKMYFFFGELNHIKIKEFKNYKLTEYKLKYKYVCQVFNNLNGKQTNTKNIEKLMQHAKHATSFVS